jgi:hypothetical protein
VNTNLFRIFIVYICIAVGDQIMKWRRVGINNNKVRKKTRTEQSHDQNNNKDRTIKWTEQ